MAKPLVYLDCDGVLANFVRGWLDSVEELTGFRFEDGEVVTWNPEESPFFERVADDVGKRRADLAKEVWNEVGRIGWCRSLPAFEGAREAVERLREVADVECATAPFHSSRYWPHERI